MRDCILKLLRSEVLTAVNVKVTVMWDVTLCSLLAAFQCFRRSCSQQLQGSDMFSILKVEVVAFSEMLIPVYRTT